MGIRAPVWGRTNPSSTSVCWEIARGGWGGKTYHAFFWGGGGKRTVECPLQNQFGGPRKWDSSGLCLFSLRKMTGREQGGGKSYHRWGCPKPFLGRGLWYVFPSLFDMLKSREEVSSPVPYRSLQPPNLFPAKRMLPSPPPRPLLPPTERANGR